MYYLKLFPIALLAISSGIFAVVMLLTTLEDTFNYMRTRHSEIKWEIRRDLALMIVCVGSCVYLTRVAILVHVAVKSGLF